MQNKIKYSVRGTTYDKAHAYYMLDT